MVSIRGWLWALLALPGCALAQDPLAGDPLAADDAEAPASIDWWGEARLWYDQVDDLEARDDIARTRLRVRTGWRGVHDAWEWGATLEGLASSEDNAVNRINLDNERNSDLGIDELFARWNFGESSSLLVGKTAMPLRLSPMVFDPDLRPAGISLSHARGFGDFHRFSVVAGVFTGDHLYGDESRLAAIQAGLHFREGMPWSFEGLLAWLDWSDLDTLAVQGLGRTNQRILGGRVFRSDYEIVDLQLATRGTLYDWPFRLEIDLARNIGVVAAPGLDEGNLRDAARISAVLGDRRGLNGVEIGAACQRIQRDAVLAPFSDDEWWFHSFARGCLPWVGYGISDHLSTRVAFSRERRDDQSEDIERFLVDLEYRW